jgi:hypothetical protein
MKTPARLIKHHTYKPYGIEDVVLTVLGFEFAFGKSRLQTPAALPLENVSWYSLNERLGGPQRRSGRGNEEKNSCTYLESKPGCQPTACLLC